MISQDRFNENMDELDRQNPEPLHRLIAATARHEALTEALEIARRFEDSSLIEERIQYLIDEAYRPGNPNG